MRQKILPLQMFKRKKETLWRKKEATKSVDCLTFWPGSEGLSWCKAKLSDCLLVFSLHFSTLLNFTQLYSTLLYFTLFNTTFFFFTLLDSTQLYYPPLIESTLLYSTLLHFYFLCTFSTKF